MTTSSKKTLYLPLSFLIIFLAGYLLSSGQLASFINRGVSMAASRIDISIAYDKMRYWIYPDASQFFKLPDGEYARLYPYSLSTAAKEFTRAYSTPVSFAIAVTVLSNALFNALFQPVFLCVFTPQAALNYLLFPFFLYGSLKYFMKVPLMIIFFFICMVSIGLNNSVTEALIRHRMTCELIYILIGLAGFTGWITKS